MDKKQSVEMENKEIEWLISDAYEGIWRLESFCESIAKLTTKDKETHNAIWKIYKRINALNTKLKKLIKELEEV